MSDRLSPCSAGLASTLAALVLASLSSCSSLAGEHSGGRYTAPDELFSLPVPDLSAGAKIEDELATDPKTKLLYGMVSFHDDFGRVRAIQYQQLVPDVARLCSDPARAPEVLRGYARDVTLAEVQSRAPRARIVLEEAVALPDGLAGWFAVLDIPEGSPLVVTSAEHPDGRRLDSTRGFLLLCRGELFLTLSAANDSVFDLVLPGRPPPGEVDVAAKEGLESTLTELYASMSFD